MHNQFTIKPPCINNIPLIGHKRDYNNFNASSDTCTPSANSNDSPIIKPDDDSITHKNTNAFTSHLPPLTKKRKIVSPPSFNTIRVPIVNVHTPYSAPHKYINCTSNVAPIYSMCILPPSITNANTTAPANLNVNSNITNQNNFNLDTLISQIASLPNINVKQIQLLNQLILCSSNVNTRNQNNNMIQVTNGQGTNGIITDTQMPAVNLNNVSDKQNSNVHTYTGQNINTYRNTAVDMRKSCHQCKTKKYVNILFHCTKTRPCGHNSFKKKTCRKKYCKSCMNKYYMENDIIKFANIKDRDDIWKWECPACLNVCTCKACKRKRKQVNSHIEPTIVNKHRHNIVKQNVINKIQPTANNNKLNIRAPAYQNNALMQTVMLKNPNIQLLFR